MPINTGPILPIGTAGAGPLPGSVGTSAFTNSNNNNSQLNFGDIDWGNIGGDLLGWLKNNWQGLVKAGLATATTVEAIKNSQAANNYTGKALDGAQKDYDARAPFREAAGTKLAATRPDLSAMFADPGNPYSKSGRLPSVGSQIPMSGWPGAPGGPPFVPTPGVNGDPNAGLTGTVDAPRQPLPINPPAQSGPISAGPQNRPGVMPPVPPMGPMTPMPPRLPVVGARVSY